MAPNFLVRPTIAGSPIISADGVQAMTSALNLGTHLINNVTDPASAQDAATKNYTDVLLQTFDYKASVRVATTANITLSGTQTIDGVAVIAGERVLVKDQSTGANNGIYVVASGAWSRSTDADTSAKVTAGMMVWVNEGTVNGDQGFVLTTNDAITLATTALTFTNLRTALGLVAGGVGDIWVEKAGDTMSGNLTLDSTLTLSPSAGSQDYVVTGRATAVVVQSQTAGQGAALELFAKDGDTTDSVAWSLWSLGTPTSVTDSERLVIGWNPIDSQFRVLSVKSGTGVARPIAIYTEADIDQFIIATSGKVAVQQASPTAQFEVVGTATTGETGRFTRNLTATSTDSPVFNIIQDHASDDQAVLRLQQDGIGDIFQALDATANALVVADGGNVGIGPGATTPPQILYINKDTNATIRMRIENPNAGNAAQAGFDLVNDLGHAYQMFVTGSGLTPSGLTVGDMGLLQANQMSLLIKTIGSFDMIFATNNTERMRLLAGGGVAVGTLTALGATWLGVEAGTSNNDAAVGGVIYETRTVGGNVGAGEDILSSYSLPGNSLSADGMGIRVRAWGTFANNANTKRLRFRFGTAGTNLVFDSTATGIANQIWVLDVEVTRTGAATQKGRAQVSIGANGGGTGATTFLQSTTALNQTLSGAITVEVTGEAVSNNDVTCEEFVVEWLDSNT